MIIDGQDVSVEFGGSRRLRLSILLSAIRFAAGVWIRSVVVFA